MLYYIVIVNIIGLILMYLDKQRAIKRKYRISESMLFFVAIIGGALAMFFAMHLFHHKTKKVLFSIGFPVLAIIQITIFLYFV